MVIHRGVGKSTVRRSSELSICPRGHGAETLDTAQDLFRDGDQLADKSFVHFVMPFVFTGISLAVAMIQKPAIVFRDRQRRGQSLKHYITLLVGPVSVPAQRRERERMACVVCKCEAAFQSIRRSLRVV